MTSAYTNSNLYTFEKDKSLKFISCNENFARLAGLDSPKQIRGKIESDLYGVKAADFCLTNQFQVLNGSKTYINMTERLQYADKIMDKLVTIETLYNRLDEKIGILGSFIDITGYQLVKMPHKINSNDRLYLGKNFNNEYLTKREAEVLKNIIFSYSAKRIAQNLKLSPRTVEGYINTIKAKLQCKTKGDIVATAFSMGLVHMLFSN